MSEPIESMKQFLRRCGGFAFGIAFSVAIVYIALEIHWTVHRLLGDAAWIITARLSLAFVVGIGVGLYIAHIRKSLAIGPEGQVPGEAG